MESVPPVGEQMQKNDAKRQGDENARIGARVTRLRQVRLWVIHGYQTKH
jgi:hypothetical protein